MRLQRVPHREIDFHSEQIAQMVLQFDKAEKARCFRETHEDVEIAVGPRFAAKSRTEQSQRLDVESIGEQWEFRS